MFRTQLTEMLGIDYPVLQGGMRWLARAELVAAVGNAGGLGFLSAHTHATGAQLREEIERTRALTAKPFGVNLTVLPANTGFDYEGYTQAIIESEIPVVETAGSNPAKYIERFRAAGVQVIHKCTTVRHAVKAEKLGASAVTIDGFECAGHPGEEDIPGLVLIPSAVDQLKIPVVGCGGFADGRGLVAALALGAQGINMGTRFLLTRESPAHEAVKARLVAATARETVLVGRSYGDSIRVLRNALVGQALAREREGGATHHDLDPLVGAARWMKAMGSGEHEDAAIPVGLSVGLVHDLPSCAELIERIVSDARALIESRLPRMLKN